MLTCEEACKIGQKACIDAIGYEFAVQNKSRSVFAYSELPGMIHLKIRQDTATSTSRGGMPPSFHLLCTVH